MWNWSKEIKSVCFYYDHDAAKKNYYQNAYEVSDWKSIENIKWFFSHMDFSQNMVLLTNSGLNSTKPFLRRSFKVNIFHHKIIFSCRGREELSKMGHMWTKIILLLWTQTFWATVHFRSSENQCKKFKDVCFIKIKRNQVCLYCHSIAKLLPFSPLYVRLN